MVNFPSILEVAKHFWRICAFHKKKAYKKIEFSYKQYVYCTFCHEFADSVALRGTLPS